MDIINRIKELVKDEEYRSIREANEFYVPEILDLYKNYKDYNIDNYDLEYLMSLIRKSSKGDERYGEFLLKNCKNSVQKDFVELLSKLIAYIDVHASGKKMYNSTGRVIIGTTSIRQTQWLENFLQYKKDGKINSQNISNCIKYLDNPEKQYPILENKQIDKINKIFPNLLQTHWTICKNPLNNTYLIKELLYKCKEIRDLWDLYTIEKLQTQDIAAIAIYTLILNNANETEFIFDKLKNTEFVQKALNVKNKRNFQFPSVIKNSNNRNYKNPLFTINNKNNNEYYGLTNYGKDVSKNILEKLQDSIITAIGEDDMNQNEITIQPLNQILYGPPGTGKTYNTIVKAMEIIGSENVNMKNENGNFKTNYSLEEYKKLKEEFNTYKKNGRIEFITFHQSYSYEEFVEGIKPYIPKNIWEADIEKIELPEIKYIGKKGIFRKICQKAKISSDKFDTFFSNLKEYLKNNSIELLLDDKKTKITIENAEKSDSIKIIPHTEKATVNYVKKSELQNPEEMNGREGYAKAILNLMHAKYVLIIDEINRGNISKIFGELITLIEDDKRENVTGDKTKEYNTIKVTLPYSDSEFSVPNNLYIIGTMNTADRSIALLDTALRRRFDFIEMIPKPDLLKNKVVEGIEGIGLQDFLTKLNKNIREIGKLDKDHEIGHAYLINVKTKDDLKHAFLNKVYPLLQEYFYNDYEIIKNVLGGYNDFDNIYKNDNWFNAIQSVIQE